ncbi:sulfatase-like hydrolase/transferase [bacterium]|nr:sulfatase-like hydrolase/transferase [bacterium]
MGSVQHAVANANERKPNVVVILSDDQGWGDLSVHGNHNLSTPHIDSLARDGALFERFYVCPVCSPTRAEFLTGRYHPRGNVFNVSTGGERLDLDERTLADVFKAAGYATGAFGKWHNGTQYPYHPCGRGFDEYYGFCSGHWGNYFNPPLEHNGQLVTGDGYITDDLTTHAMNFIRQHREGPFLCYVPYNTPHSPMQVPDNYYDKFRDAALPDRFQNPKQEELPMTRAALAMCENIDDNVGRILALLDELKLTDNTIVLYFSDNGPNSFRWNDGMKGRKGSTDEGGVRSPLLIRWPGHIPAGRRVPQISGAIDLLPSLAELAQVKIPEDRPLDGMSFVPWLTVGNDAPTDRLIFSHWAGKVSVRNQRYRLDAQGQLYDLVNDPGQTTAITQQEPKVTQALQAAVEDWKREILSQLERVDRPFTVGYPQFPITYLPARDGVPHGGVERSGKAPNCSFFRNWTSTDDAMTWDVDIATAGDYEVTIYYAVAKSDLGSTIALSLGDETLTANVTEAHDPPLYGQEQDRVDRGSESYVKDFRPWALGKMTLPAGTGQLTLKATDVKASQVMEVRGLTLTLQNP